MSPRLVLTRRVPPAVALAGLALGLSAPAAQAQVTLNFDSFNAAAQGTGTATIGPTYTTQGFTLTSGTTFVALYGSNATYGSGETSLYSNSASSTTVTRSGGGAFAFTGIDLGIIPMFAADGPPATVTFTGTKQGGGTVTATDAVAGLSGFQSFTNFSSFTNLTSLTFAPTGSINTPSFDNVKLTPAAPVPEASTTVSLGLLLALGLGGVLVAAKRKKTSAS